MAEEASDGSQGKRLVPQGAAGGDRSVPPGQRHWHTASRRVVWLVSRPHLFSQTPTAAPWGPAPTFQMRTVKTPGGPASEGQTLTGSHLSGCKAGLLGTLPCLPAGGSRGERSVHRGGGLEGSLGGSPREGAHPKAQGSCCNSWPALPPPTPTPTPPPPGPLSLHCPGPHWANLHPQALSHFLPCQDGLF